MDWTVRITLLPIQQRMEPGERLNRRCSRRQLLCDDPGFGCSIYHFKYVGIGSGIRSVIPDGERHTAIDQRGNLKKVEVTQNGETTTYKKKKQRSELAGGWGTISLTQCADYNVKDLAKYGLDEANRITVTATYKDSTSGDKKTCTVYNWE